MVSCEFFGMFRFFGMLQWSLRVLWLTGWGKKHWWWRRRAVAVAVRGGMVAAGGLLCEVHRGVPLLPYLLCDE